MAELDDAELMKRLGITVGAPAAMAQDTVQARAGNGLQQPPIGNVTGAAPAGPAIAPPAPPMPSMYSGPSKEERELRKRIEMQEGADIARREGDIGRDRQALANEANKSTFAKMDLSPLMQVAAAAGYDPAKAAMYKAPVDQTHDLRAALEKNQEGLATSQNAFLKNQMDKSNSMQQRMDLMNQRLIMNYSDKMGSSLDPYKATAGTPFGVAARKMQAADALNVLAQQVPDLNFSKQQMTELATASANLLSGGNHSAQAQIEHLLPPGVQRNAAGIEDWLTGSPHGTGQMGFAKMMLDTANREHDLAADQIYKTQNDRLAQFQGLKRLSPADFDMIKNQHVIAPKHTVQETVADIKNNAHLAGAKTAVAHSIHPSDADIANMNEAQLNEYLGKH